MSIFIHKINVEVAEHVQSGGMHMIVSGETIEGETFAFSMDRTVSEKFHDIIEQAMENLPVEEKDGNSDTVQELLNKATVAAMLNKLSKDERLPEEVRKAVDEELGKLK